MESSAVLWQYESTNRRSVGRTMGAGLAAVDHSDYRMETRPEAVGEGLTAFVDRTVIRKRTPF